MSIIGSNILAGSSGQGGAYEIEQSLRFRGAQKLQRTVAVNSAGPPAPFTISLWAKRGSDFGSNSCLWNFYIYDGISQGDFLLFNTNNGLSVQKQGGLAGYGSTNDVFRDPSAWYHIVVSFKGVTGTGDPNFVKVYVNGRETNWNLGAAFDGWYCGAQRAGCNVGIGQYIFNGTQSFDGYMAEIHAVDGQVVDPTDFGEYNDDGVWVPKQVSGVTYGTNGWYLDFSDPSNIGADRSGNGNNFSPTGFTTSGTGTDVMFDTPTTNWCTLNPLDVVSGGFGLRPNALSNGNLVDLSTYNALAKGTLAVDSGKWYFEYTGWTSTAFKVGVALVPRTSTPFSNTDLKLLNYNGQYQSSAPTGTPGGTTYGGSISSTDIIGVAVDMDNRTIAWSKNGQYGDGSGNWDETYANASKISLESTGGVTPCCLNGGTTASAQTFNFGQRDFEYTPPTGFSAINTSTLPAPDIADGGKHFGVITYTGNGTARSFTGLGFQPDFVWIKSRAGAVHGAANHGLFDAVRGTNKGLFSSSTATEGTFTHTLTSFDTDGFSLGTDADWGGTNQSSTTYVAWCWLAGNGTSSNTAGSITSTVSANPTAGFSIVSFNSGASGSKTVGHGLGVAPQMIITKDRDNATNWTTYHASATTATDKYLNLNGDASVQTASGIWGATLPTSTLFGFGSGTASAPNADVIAYCFAEVEGYSKFGSYTGNGSTDGPFVYCGFRPAWIMYKRSNAGGGWYIYDAERSSANGDGLDKYLKPHLSAAEDNDGAYNTTEDVDFLSNGFKIRDSGGDVNVSGGEYIFMCFASNPFGGEGVSPATAR
jgi:hypothetical protein